MSEYGVAFVNNLIVRSVRRMGIFPLVARARHALRGVRSRSPKLLAADGLPIPDARHILAVNGNTDAALFLETGERAAETVRDVLRRNGVRLENLQAILDFGCGCGRVTRYWRSLTPLTSISGTDFNPNLVAWCRDNLTFADFTSNRLQPPLAYASACFDLVYAFSVFSHFPLELQRPWVEELMRILKPGGRLLFSVHGDFYIPSLTDAERQRYEHGELVVRHDVAAGTNLCAAFHPPSYVRRQLLAGYDLVEFAPEGALGNPRQDIYFIRKSQGAS
jgi:SAM-dependent methyltransferase